MINLEHQSRKYFSIILNIYEKKTIFLILTFYFILSLFFMQYKYLQNIFNISFYDYHFSIDGDSLAGPDFSHFLVSQIASSQKYKF